LPIALYDFPVSLAENLDSIQQRIRAACERAGREPSSVTLLGVTKGQPPDAVNEAARVGLVFFGENKIQEAKAKIPLCSGKLRWHFIGHLQTNKVKQIVDFVHLIHAVDSFKLLQEINKQAEKIKRNADCLLQAHIAREETKFGLNEQELNDLVDQISNAQLHNVAVCGLMGMASFTDDPDKVRKEFRFLKSLQDKLANVKPRTSNFKLQTLTK